MDDTYAVPSRELLSLKPLYQENSRESGRSSSVQAERQPRRDRMTADCLVCGAACTREQWVAGGGAFACSLGCLEGGA